jgi:hypothetical protein
MSTTDTTRLAYVSLGYGGWGGAPLPNNDPDALGRTVRISGYGTGWRDYLDAMPDDAPIINLRALDQLDDRLWALSVSGPMVDPDVPDGMVNKLGGAVPFDPRPEIGRPERCALLGNAHGFDYVSPATYAELARKHGADVTTAAAARADESWGA